MRLLFVILPASLILTTTEIYSQKHVSAPSLTSLSKVNFKWRDFSFDNPWSDIKILCEVDKLDNYSEDFYEFYCGPINDTGKAYSINSNKYHVFSDILFDNVILHLAGSTKSNFNFNTLNFFKKIKNKDSANVIYRRSLRLLSEKFGEGRTQYLTKFNSEALDTSMERPTMRAFLNERTPFSAAYKTEWNENGDVYVEFKFIPEANILILSINEFLTKSLFGHGRNWFDESEYDERFTDIFKDFDKKKGYKGIKFGMSKAQVSNTIKFSPINIVKEYLVLNNNYKLWYNILFDDCALKFNRNGKLYDVTLDKEVFSDADYEGFLDDIVKLFGPPNKYRDVSGKFEFTFWKGHNFNIIVMRNQTQSLYIEMNCVKLDDSSIADKLY